MPDGHHPDTLSADAPTRSSDLPSTLPPAAGPGSMLHIDHNTHIPGYVLTLKLGHGAYGQVWQAVRVSTGQDVAVKIFTQPAALDWRYLQREVDLLLRVAEHPHIVTLLDANLQNQPPFYAMTLLRSGSLARFCTPQQRLSNIDQAVRWFEQITMALDFAHAKGLLHCDLKPGNVLLDEEDNARLVDFGQSQMRGEAARALGTLNYMAPEQAVVADPGGHPPDVSVSWDIYGVGATMYAVLAEQPPHSHVDLERTLSDLPNMDQRLAQYRQHVSTTPITPLRQLNRAVDRDLADIIEHCLQPDPARRYRNISELSADLKRRREFRPLLCRPHSGTYVVRKFARRNVGMIVIALAAVLALATIGAILFFTVQSKMEELRSKDRELEVQLDNFQRELERVKGAWMDPLESTRE